VGTQNLQWVPFERHPLNAERGRVIDKDGMAYLFIPREQHTHTLLTLQLNSHVDVKIVNAH
jgi:hypothetical protein